MPRQELEQLLNQLNWATDQSDVEGVLSLFTEDAWLEGLDHNGTVLLPRITGREQLRAFFSQSFSHRAARDHRQRHIVSNMTIEAQDATTATVVSYHTALGIVNGEPALDAIAWARDQCTIGEGEWRISCRTMHGEATSASITALVDDIVTKRE